MGSLILGSAVYLFTPDFRKVLLLKRSAKKRFKPGAWGSVGGKMESGETPIQAAVRETWEEAGIRLKPTGLRLLGCTNLFRPGRHAVIFCFGGILKERKVKLNHEHTAYGWFDLNKLPTPATGEDFKAWRKKLRPLLKRIG